MAGVDLHFWVANPCHLVGYTMLYCRPNAIPPWPAIICYHVVDIPTYCWFMGHFKPWVYGTLFVPSWSMYPGKLAPRKLLVTPMNCCQILHVFDVFCSITVDFVGS
jgi:hypothetical protein